MTTDSLLVLLLLLKLKGVSGLAMDSQLLKMRELQDRVMLLEEKVHRMRQQEAPAVLVVSSDPEPASSSYSATTTIDTTTTTSNNLVMGALLNENFGLPTILNQIHEGQTQIKEGQTREILAKAVQIVGYNSFYYHPIFYSSRTSSSKDYSKEEPEVYRINGIDKRSSEELVRDMIFKFQSGWTTYKVPGMVALMDSELLLDAHAKKNNSSSSLKKKKNSSLNNKRRGDDLNRKEVVELTIEFFDRLQRQISELTGTYPCYVISVIIGAGTNSSPSASRLRI